MLVTVITPFFNEELVVREFHKRLSKVTESIRDHNFEFVFVNDGSTDDTLGILRELQRKDKRIKVIDFSRNFGHQAAIFSGIRNAAGDAAVIIDGDLQDPPELIAEMIKKWEDGNDVVFAKRIKRKGETLFKKSTACMYYALMKLLSDTPIPRDVGDFRLIDRKVIAELKGINESNLFIRGIIPWIGFTQKEVEYERDERYAGSTKYSFIKMLNLGLDGITSFSIKPLRFALRVGLLCISIGLGLAVYAIVNKYFNPGIVIRGWPSLMITVIFFGGVQLFTIGLLGEYIAKIYKETKRRPLYIIREKIGFKNGRCLDELPKRKT